MTIDVAKWLNKKFFDWQSASEERKTLGDFAKMLGVSQGSLGHWMNGIRLPSGENVDKIARVFGPEIYDILGLARPDPQLDQIRQAYDKVIKPNKNHFVVTVGELAELQSKIERDDLDKITYIIRASSQRGHVVEVIRNATNLAELKQRYKLLTVEEKADLLRYIQGHPDEQ